MFFVGLAMLLGDPGHVVRRRHLASRCSGNYNKQVDTSFRMGMVWFIFSEVMFFAAFFGALFYARQFALPWLSGEGDGALTNQFLWRGFTAGWPSNGPARDRRPLRDHPGLGPAAAQHADPAVSSGVTITIAHHALRAAQRGSCCCSAGRDHRCWARCSCSSRPTEYIQAYTELNLTLGSGIYGSTFFMLTGFHGMHVTLGTIMLSMIWLRCAKGHFSKDHHFAFEAVAWYWHFVDVVWLGLFLFVYVL